MQIVASYLSDTMHFASRFRIGLYESNKRKDIDYKAVGAVA